MLGCILVVEDDPYTLVAARVRPAYWFYGHFHASATEDIAGPRFVMVASMEMYGVWSPTEVAGEAETN